MNFHIQDTSEIFTVNAALAYDVDTPPELAKKMEGLIGEVACCRVETPLEITFDAEESRVIHGAVQRFLLQPDICRPQKQAAQWYLRSQLYPELTDPYDVQRCEEIARLKAAGELVDGFTPTVPPLSPHGSAENFSDGLARRLASDSIGLETGVMAPLAA